MDDGGFEIEFEGFEELERSLETAMKRYGDIAEEKLGQTGKKFKNRVIKITHQAVYTKTGKLAKSYRLGKITGYGANISQDFWSTAPHFHLIERGHEQVTKDGKSVGWVAGRLIVEQAANEFEEELPKHMHQLLEDIIKESGLDD